MSVPDVPVALPFECFIDGPPAPKGSVSRNAGNRGVRHSASSKRWQRVIEERVRRELARGGHDTSGEVVLLAPYARPVHVIAEFRLRRPQRTVFDTPTAPRHGDADKLERCLGDALQRGGLLADDSLIECWHVHKRWADAWERDGIKLRVVTAPVGYRLPEFEGTEPLPIFDHLAVINAAGIGLTNEDGSNGRP